MKNIYLISSLKAALIVGSVGGLVAGTVHFFFTEPIIDRAIQLEQMTTGKEHPEQEIVSRTGQNAGLILGSMLLGLAVTSIFGIVYALAYSRLPGSSPLVKSVVLGLSAYIAIFMLPFLKYPSNPPGVGSSDTIFFRQSLYVGFQIISIIGVALAYLVYNHLVTKKGSKYSTSLLAIITYLTIISIAFALMPPNPDPLIVPLDLLLDFRVLSLLGQTVMWLIIAFTYGKTWWLLVRTSSSPISLAKAADGPS